jgi:phage FluMu protein Com
LSSAVNFMDVKCPKCGSNLNIKFESYKDDDTTYIKVVLDCNNCGAKYVLGTPFVEVR